MKGFLAGAGTVYALGAGVVVHRVVSEKRDPRFITVSEDLRTIVAVVVTWPWVYYKAVEYASEGGSQ